MGIHIANIKESDRFKTTYESHCGVNQWTNIFDQGLFKTDSINQSDSLNVLHQKSLYADCESLFKKIR